MRSRILLVVLLIPSACRAPEPAPVATPTTPPTTGTMSVTGHTLAGAGLAVTGTVRASTQGRELAHVTAGSDGAYSLTAEVSRDDTIVLAFELEGHATAYRTVEAAPGSALVFDVVLRDLHPMKCARGDCSLGRGRGARLARDA